MTVDKEYKKIGNLWDGFWGIQLLHIGQTLGLFEALKEASTSDELSQRLHLESRYTDLWCLAASSCGLIEKCGNEYQTPAPLVSWLTNSRGFTTSHLSICEQISKTFQAIFTGRALPEPAVLLRMILSDSLVRNYTWALNEIAPQIPELAQTLLEGKRLLEVGCGIGSGLSVLRSYYSHLELYGIEADYECAQEAERSTRAVIHVGELPDNRFSKPFDVIICFRSISASSNPLELLTQCSQLLEPSGWLILASETQDVETDRKNIARSESEYFAYQLLAGQPRLNLFTRSELKAMLEEAGLKLQQEVEAPDWGTPLFMCTRQGYCSA